MSASYMEDIKIHAHTHTHTRKIAWAPNE